MDVRMYVSPNTARQGINTVLILSRILPDFPRAHRYVFINSRMLLHVVTHRHMLRYIHILCSRMILHSLMFSCVFTCSYAQTFITLVYNSCVFGTTRQHEGIKRHYQGRTLPPSVPNLALPTRTLNPHVRPVF